MDYFSIVSPELSDDFVSSNLRLLTAKICSNNDSDYIYGLGGEFGYGENFENNVFMMHRFCWCDEDYCQWCNGDAPNFLHKKSGATINWYKWIGRDMNVSKADWSSIFQECFDSLRV